MVIHACAHSMPALSRHIGSLPGVVGLSGMHVKVPLPSRSTFMPPFSSMSMIVASCATALGAADIALAIFSLSVLGGVCFGCAAARPASATTVTRVMETRRAVMGHLLSERGRF